jgi:hypothetical protein
MNQAFIDRLSQLVYTKEGIDKANTYITSRGLDPSKLRYPCTISGSNETLFNEFSSLYPINIFINSLYIPIVDVEDPTHLVGFDVKYLGVSNFRTRFHKFKITPDTLMLYFSKNIDTIKTDEPIVVTESFLDAVTIEQLGYTVISPLTALNNLKFCLLLYAISDRIFFMYDNDDTGRKAIQKIMRNISLDIELQKCFKPIIYSGKDPNEVKMKQGSEYLKVMLKNQIRV